MTFERLELCDGKLSCRVLRGLGVSDAPRLPGITPFLSILNVIVTKSGALKV